MSGVQVKVTFMIY